MGLTSAQLERRRDNVGASDIAAIMGASPYSSALDIYNEKVYGTKPIENNEAIELGNAMEGACREMAGKALGVEMTSANPFRRKAGTVLGVNLDSWFMDGDVPIPVECKTAGMLNPFGAGDVWGAEWTDEVPAHYILQVQAQMLAIDAPHSYISAIIAGRGHAMFTITRDDELCEMILDSVADFWSHVQSKTPVPDVVASLDVLSRIERRPKSVCRFLGDPVDLVIAHEAAKVEKRLAEKAADEAKALVLQELTDFEGAELVFDDSQATRLARALGLIGPDDDKSAITAASNKAREKVALTYLEQSRTTVDTDVLRAQFPDAYEAAKKVSTYRVLRLGKAKKGGAVIVGQNPKENQS